MRYIRHLFHFFGSVTFTFVLIASVAIFVIAGTLIESATESHRFAAGFTYSNPLFGVLLWGFFVNILISALRRWPFKVRHVPFLITHFGLLMILGGVIIKHYFGLQGNLSIREGSDSNTVFENGSYAIKVETRSASPSYYPLKYTNARYLGSSITPPQADLQLHLAGFTPHSIERLASWVKGNYATITGLEPMPLVDVGAVEMQQNLPMAGKARFYKDAPPCQLFALRTASLSQTIDKLYLQQTNIRLSNRTTDELVAEIPFTKLIESPYQWKNYTVGASLHLAFSPLSGFDHPYLQISLNHKNSILLDIPLSGSQALLNLNRSTPHLGIPSLAVDIVAEPTLAIIEDEHHDVHLIAIDAHGELWWRPYRADHLESLYAYDDGYQGYIAQAELPFKVNSTDRKEREAAINHRLLQELQHAAPHPDEFSPPLQLWQRTCAQVNAPFADSLLSFLTLWNHSHSWLFPTDLALSISSTPFSTLPSILSQLDWDSVPADTQQACYWTESFFSQIEPALQQGEDILTLLRQKKWPLLSTLEAQRESQSDSTTKDAQPILTLLTQQVFAAAELLPHEEKLNLKVLPVEKQAALFSAYLRAYGIHYSMVAPFPASEAEMISLLDANAQAQGKNYRSADIVIETPVTLNCQAIPPISKLEELFPIVKLIAKKGAQSQTISLVYDHLGTALKWPIMNGQYLLSFQPLFKPIPYNIRLRNARQINYPGTSQPYSFESDLIITDSRSGVIWETTLSMNHVFETWDGYRFYLSSMSPSQEGAVKRVQIVVNHDPAKYFLTYPGACMLTLGILLLFILRPYKKS